MAALARPTLGEPSLTTKTPPPNARVGSGYAAATLPAGSPCYFGTDGSVNLSSGAAANAAAVVDGWTMQDYAVGESATLYTDVNIGYGKNGAVASGTSYYLGATAGTLDSSPTTGGTVIIARGIPDNNITGAKQHKLRVKQSY